MVKAEKQGQVESHGRLAAGFSADLGEILPKASSPTEKKGKAPAGKNRPGVAPSIPDLHRTEREA